MPHSLKKLALVVGLVAGIARAEAPDATRALAELPGFDFSKLAAPSKKELLTVFTDEFDYCGRPLTLLAVLKKGDACKHTKRLATMAALLASEGTSANEIIITLSKYHQGFAQKRTAMKADERLCLGGKDAKVTLVEFSDFECPYCAAARPALEEFARSHAAVRLCWAPFPLPGHPHSMIAGQAALFARDNGKFWAVHDAMFENQLALSDALIRELVKKAGLDVAAFNKAVGLNKYQDELNESKELGHTAGVDSTPTLFFNGRKHQLGLSADMLAIAVEDEVEWAAGNGAFPSN